MAIPFDTAKNRHQAVRAPSPSLATVSALFRREGVRGFYRGGVPILVRAFPANAAGLLGYELGLKAMANVR